MELRSVDQGEASERPIGQPEQIDRRVERAVFETDRQIVVGDVTLLPLALGTETALLRWRRGSRKEIDVVVGTKLGYALQLGDADWTASSLHDPDSIEFSGPEIDLGGPFFALSLGIEVEAWK